MFKLSPALHGPMAVKPRLGGIVPNLRAAGGIVQPSPNGEIPRYAMGGELSSPWWEKSEARGMEQPGFLHSAVPGRTDHLPVSAVADSYVLPADVLAGLGEGNSLAGNAVVDQMISTAPWGIKMPPSRRGGVGIPAPPHMMQRQAKGGTTQGGGPVKILAAGGEKILTPQEAMALASHAVGKRVVDMKHAHAILDKWVVHERKKQIKTISKLKGPTK